MSIILIGKNKNREAIVDEDLLEMLSMISWGYSNGYAVGYPVRGERQVTMHRLIMGFPPDQIDHINRNKLDNRRCNLRVADYSLNSINRGLFRTTKSGHHGIGWDTRKNKWTVRIRRNDIRYFVGLFSDLEQAVSERDEFLATHGFMEATI